MLLPGCAGKAIEAPPSEGGSPMPAGAAAASEAPPAPITRTQVSSHDVEHCQLELSMNAYDSNGVRESTNTRCLDEKTDEEIRAVIQEARNETCETPFCGCWLG